MADIATVAKELAAAQAPDEAPASAAETSPAEAAPTDAADAASSAEPAPATGLIGALDADERIRAAMEQNGRTRWTAAAGVTLLYATLIVWHVASGGSTGSLAAIQERQERERRGQDGTTISVELVPDPDRNSKTTKWREGTEQGPSPNPAPPQPQQQAALPRPPVEELQAAEQTPEEQPPEEPQAEKEEAEKDQAEKTDGGNPNLLDLEQLVDAAAMNFSQNVKAHFERRQQQQQRPRQQQQALYSGGGMQVRGSGASGKSDEFSRSVIAALMKTRPGPFALWGRVLVTFQITQQGDLLYVRVLHSSGNKALDDAAVNAIHRARFQKPPPDLGPDARTYIIDYIFG